MIKKYSMETFFSPQKEAFVNGHKRAATAAEIKPSDIFKAEFKPTEQMHPTMRPADLTQGTPELHSNKFEIGK